MEEPHRRDQRHSGGNVKVLVGFPGVDPARQRTPTAYICPTVERGAWDRSKARACFVILALWDRSYARWGRTSRLRSSKKFALSRILGRWSTSSQEGSKKGPKRFKATLNSSGIHRVLVHIGTCTRIRALREKGEPAA